MLLSNNGLDVFGVIVTLTVALSPAATVTLVALKPTAAVFVVRIGANVDPRVPAADWCVSE